MDGFNMNQAGNAISMEGFQLVSGQMFSRVLEPSMSIWYSSISFNTACYSALNDCGCIQLMVNSKAKRILITPCPAKDKDAITWLKPTDRHKYKKIECSKFTHQLFDVWGLDKELHYRTNGKLVTSGNRVMLLFDFTAPEHWRGLKMVNGIGQ